MKKLNTILLLDDNEHDNFFHELIIEDLGCTNQILSLQKANEALDYLLSRNGTSLPYPDLAFIDINMPKMDGFDFLKKYKTLHGGRNTKTVFVILTTSINPEDKKKANSFEEVVMFEIKPLDEEMLTRILNKCFPDSFSIELLELN